MDKVTHERSIRKEHKASGWLQGGRGEGVDAPSRLVFDNRVCWSLQRCLLLLLAGMACQRAIDDGWVLVEADINQSHPHDGTLTRQPRDGWICLTHTRHDLLCLCLFPMEMVARLSVLGTPNHVHVDVDRSRWSCDRKYFCTNHGLPIDSHRWGDVKHNLDI